MVYASECVSGVERVLSWDAWRMGVQKPDEAATGPGSYRKIRVRSLVPPYQLLGP